jgi:hypothetical protein
LCCQCKTGYTIDGEKFKNNRGEINHADTQKIIVMKTQTTNFFKALNAKALNTLTTEVKETVATNMDSNKSTLKAIDFWNLQRIQKSRTCGRFPGISVR